MIKIKFLKKVEKNIGAGAINPIVEENEIVSPDILFNNLDEAWSYAIKHGAEPTANFHWTVID